jgi:hypothetical protein
MYSLSQRHLPRWLDVIMAESRLIHRPLTIAAAPVVIAPLC